MAQFIIFDGDFSEVEVSWLQAEEEGEEWDVWLSRNGFSKQELWGIRPEWNDMFPRGIEVFAHKEEPRWVVTVSSGGQPFDFVIEGRVNYLKFLSSSLCSSVDLQDHLRACRVILERSFRAWHGHDAPENEEDQSLETGCALCDPHGEPRRQQEREARTFRQAARRAQKWKRERGRQWVAEKRAELNKPSDE